MENRPQGRQKRVTGSGAPLSRRGAGQSTGPVGSSSGYSGRTGRSTSGGSGNRSAGSGGGMIKLIVLVLVVIFGGGGGLMSMLGGDSDLSTPNPSYNNQQTTNQGASQGSLLGDLFGTSGTTGGYAGTGSSAGWLDGNNTGKLNTAVSNQARARYTTLRGSGRDTVTIMVYMCGTDLESKSGMATKDLQEMLNASLSSKVNLLVYTGGCTAWKNNVISSSANQIYKVENDGLVCLEKNAGTGSMTLPKTLTSFITYCTDNYPADRNMLILWDHGGGSITGYGYDEKNKSSGAMSLKELDQALSAAKTSFDVIGFDACLMATLENALTMAPYADYLIASEETEPGLGWYYTGWLTSLSKNTSMSTLELGKQIADDFVSACAQSCPGQKTTLSVVDLAELEATVPDDFKAFATSTLELLKNDGYETVSAARSGAREFAVSSKVDQIDLVHMALKLKTDEGRALADAILSAVKYNRTSSNMTNAYGLSMYFPYQKVSGVGNAVNAYKDIGMDSAYTDCIRTFATLEAGGQASAGGSTSPMTSLGGGSYTTTSVGGDLLSQILGQMLGASSDRSLDLDAAADYLNENRFDTDALVWTTSGSDTVMRLSESQWAMVRDLELNVFADDGTGYIDLGMDNVFSFNDDGDLLGEYDGTWLAIDNQNVAYYMVDTTADGDSYTITGRVPVLLNGSRADLILVFTDKQPYGYIAGARTDYRDGETETVAKSMTELEVGDTIDFLCDYYAYDGTFLDSFVLGNTHIYTGTEQISNVYISLPAVATYRFTDIYNNSFWTPAVP